MRKLMLGITGKWAGAVFAAAALLSVLAGCSGSGGSDALERTEKFRVTFTPNPVDAVYDGRAFWWRYEVAGENVSDEGLHLAGYYVDRGDKRWLWQNVNLPYPAGRRLRLSAQSVRIDPAKVPSGARVVHQYRFVVLDGAGKFEVPAAVELRF